MCLLVQALTGLLLGVAAVLAADPNSLHLLDLSSGYCLVTGVANAPGGLTLQPGCNLPNDSQVCKAAICSSHAMRMYWLALLPVEHGVGL